MTYRLAVHGEGHHSDGGPHGAPAWLVRERASTPAPGAPRLLDRVRAAIRVRHLSRRTEGS